MKNDMRITYPLWQMGAISILMVLVLMTSYSSNFETFSDGGFEFAIIFQGELGVLWGITLLVSSSYALLFCWNSREAQ